MKLPRFAHSRAARLSKSPSRIQDVVRQAKQKLARRSLKDFASIQLLLDYLIAVVHGRFAPVSKPLVIILGGVIYFLMPLDLVSDFVPVAGLLDDASVLGWVLTAVAGELERFSKWQDRNKAPAAPPSPGPLARRSPS